jgi:hypothetical protein
MMDLFICCWVVWLLLGRACTDAFIALFLARTVRKDPSTHSNDSVVGFAVKAV